MENEDAEAVPVLCGRIKQGLIHLAAFRNETGLFSIFKDKFTAEATVMVLRNLVPVLQHRKFLEHLFTELFSLIDRLRKSFSSIDEKDIRGTIGPLAVTLSMNEETLFDPAGILARAHEQLKSKNDRLILIGKGLVTLPVLCCYIASALLDEKTDRLLVSTGESVHYEKIYHGGFRGFFERLGLLSPGRERHAVPTTDYLDDALSSILGEIVIAHPGNSFAPTVLSMAMLVLISGIRREMDGYLYRSDGREFSPKGICEIREKTEIASPLTFVRRIVPMKQRPERKDGPAFRISARSITRGQYLRIGIEPGVNHYETYRLLVPAHFEPARSSERIWSDQSVFMNAHGCREIVLRAARRGKGHVRVLVENMYNPSLGYITDLGWIEVV